MATYNRDFYFSEQQKQEIIRLCVNEPKLPIIRLEIFCREAREEIQAWRKKPEFPMNGCEGNFADQNGSHGRVAVKKPSQFSSEDEDSFVPLFKPYVPRPPIGAQFVHLSPKEIEKIRLSFIEHVYYSTPFPIAYEDMASLIDHVGQPMLAEDLLLLFGYTSFATMVREMPEFYFLDIYLAADSKLWFVNKQMPSKTKFFQSEEKPIPKKGVQISIAETVYLEPDMIHFKGRLAFVTVLQKCLKNGRDDRDGWVSFTTFQEYLSKCQKTDFKNAWKTLIPDIGQIKRVWNEIVWRDILYDHEAGALKLKDDPQKLLRRIYKEEEEAFAFWEKLKIQMTEFVAEQAEKEAPKDDDWADDGNWGENDSLDWSKPNPKVPALDPVNVKPETAPNVESDPVDQKRGNDDGYEEVQIENQKMRDSSVSDITPPVEAITQNEISLTPKDNLSPTTTPVEETTAVIKTKKYARKHSRTFDNDSESDEEEYRVENYPSRSEHLLMKLIAPQEDKNKDVEQKEDRENNSAVENNLDEKVNNDVEEKKLELGQSLGIHAEENRNEEKESKILPVNQTISEAVEISVNKEADNEEVAVVKDVETEEIQHIDAISETALDNDDEENVERSKLSQQKQLSMKKFPDTKSKIKKMATFTARKIKAKAADGSESDEEDVRMENTNPIIVTPKISTVENFDDDRKETKSKSEIPLPPVPELRKAFVFKFRNDRKSKRGNPQTKFNSTAELSKSLDEMMKRVGLSDENEEKIKENEEKIEEGEKKKKHKAMMDFGSEAEYTDEDSSEGSTPPETIHKKEDEIKEKEKSPSKPTSTRRFKPDFRPKQFQARKPEKVFQQKIPAKSNDKLLYDRESDDSEKGW